MKGIRAREILLGIILGLVIVLVLTSPDWISYIKKGKVSHHKAKGISGQAAVSKPQARSRGLATIQKALPKKGVGTQGAKTTGEPKTSPHAGSIKGMQASKPTVSGAESKTAQAQAMNQAQIPSSSQQNSLDPEKQRWKEVMKLGATSQAMAAYPYYSDFMEAEQKTHVPAILLLALADIFSGFDINAVFGERIGLLRVSPIFAPGLSGSQLRSPGVNIQVAAKRIKLLEDRNKDMLLAILAYWKDRLDYPAWKVQDEDLFFLKRIRTQAQKILSEPYQRVETYPLMGFNDPEAAESMRFYIEQKTKIPLYVARKYYRYEIMLPAKDRSEFENKKSVIESIVGEIKPYQ